jgi:hypothetical protein
MTAEEIRDLRERCMGKEPDIPSNFAAFFLAEIAAQLAEMNGSRLAYRKGLADGISACITPENDPHWPTDCTEAIEWWERFKDHRLT